MGTSEDFHSLDPDPEEFRELGYKTVDMMADHFAQVREVDTFPDTTPSEVAEEFDDPLPIDGEDPEAVLAEWTERVYPYATHQGSPRWYGYVMGSGTPIGALADALAASVNMNVGAWMGGPSATEIERQCLRWLAEMIGYPTDCGGVLTSGGTMANHTAIYAALQSTTDFETRASGLRADDRQGRFTLYESAHEDHSSVERVAEMIGVGSDAIRSVPCDDDYRMDPGALDDMLSEDVENGNIPFCVVAYVGSINVSAIDPLAEIADVCADYDVWMHADGACGAVGAILPEREHRYEGLERADSVTLDPHKWLSVPYSCGCVLFRDPEVQARAFSMHADYLDFTDEEAYHGANLGFRGPEMSRPFRALKLWMSLKHRGVEGYRQLLRQNCQCAEHLHDRVVAADDFEMLQEPNLFIYSFRYLPTDLRDGVVDAERRNAINDYADWLNQRIADELRFTGEAFVTTTEVQDHTAIRLSICSHRTRATDIDRTFEALREHGERIDAEDREKLNNDFADK
jgi:glutamate/tyrosine decarboxylase-like PLP-dependent enzyme